MVDNRTLLIRYLGDTPKLRIIDFFLDNRGSDYSKKEIIEHSGVSKTTFYKVWDELMEFGILKPTRRYGKAQLYELDYDNPVIRKFRELDKALSMQAMERATEEAVPA